MQNWLKKSQHNHINRQYWTTSQGYMYLLLDISWIDFPDSVKPNSYQFFDLNPAVVGDRLTVPEPCNLSLWVTRELTVKTICAGADTAHLPLWLPH